MSFISSIIATVKLRRLIEPLLLSSSANIIINYIFDPESPDFLLGEFVIAFLLVIPITELNHFIDRPLDKIFSWTANPWKRFLAHLVCLLIVLIVSLDIIGNIYMWVVYNSFYTWSELLLINVVTLVFSLVLTTIKWATDFYMGWKRSEKHLEQSKNVVTELASQIQQSTEKIELQKGKAKQHIEVQNILLAKSEQGIVRVLAKGEVRGLYAETLSKLTSQLPQNLFFPASRNLTIHREAIQLISTASFGKVAVKLKVSLDEQEQVMISRPKAASFRKWFNSNSPHI